MLLHCCEKVLGIQEGKHLSSPHIYRQSQFYLKKFYWRVLSIGRQDVLQQFDTSSYSPCLLSVRGYQCPAPSGKQSIESEPEHNWNDQHLRWSKCKLFWIVAVWCPGWHSIPKWSISIKLMIIYQHCSSVSVEAEGGCRVRGSEK